MSSSVTPDRSKSCCCQGMPSSLAHHSLDAMGKFITRPIAAKGLFLEAVDPEKTTRGMNISATSNSSFVDGRFYLYTQLATGISLMILSPITVISNLLLLLTIYKDPLKCFHTPASYLIIALGCVDFTTGLVMEPLFIAYRLASYLKMVTISRPIIRKTSKNWKFYFHHRSQLVILARSRSHLDTVPCHNSPTTLPLGHYNAQDPCICWYLDAVLHRFHSSAIHRSLPKKPPSDKSPFPCHSHNNPAFRWFCYTSEVTSPICQRISPK